MEKSTIIIIAVIAVIIIGLPLAGQIMKSVNSSAPAQSESTESAAESGGGSDAKSEEPAAPTAPPAFDANSLVGTVWQIPVDKASLTVTFQPGGAFIGQSQMLRMLIGTDTLQGTWTVSGSNLTISANVKGKAVSAKGTISGDQILIKGKPAQRLQ